MIKTERTIFAVKDKIFNLQGKGINVTVNLGRNKKAVYTGKLGGVYSDIFTIVPDGKRVAKTTFSYADVICGSVVIKERKITEKI